jgi:primosomal protein N' (replication factor Y) (superfamily II helicase)
VLVPFGSGKRIGVIIALVDGSDLPRERLKPVTQIYRDARPFCQKDLAFFAFCRAYYHHPLGRIMLNALPPGLRRSAPLRNSRTARRSAQAPPVAANARPPRLNPEQAAAVGGITQCLGKFAVWLLHGVTGSGKTEVYLRVIEEVIKGGGQALVLVPEINLTPQLETRFQSRFPALPVVSLHSEIGAAERTRRWLAAQCGEGVIVLGTRLAVFTPLPRLALIVVDEEHDSSFKQQDGFRYSARDLAVLRARQRGVPVVLGSATPSLESYHNALRGRYHLLQMRTRAARSAELPKVRLVDMRRYLPVDGLTQPLVDALCLRLERAEQSLIFINRRGYAPVLVCAHCGWASGCPRCSAKLVVHLTAQRLRCHHCGHAATLPARCPVCGEADLKALGHGTQRIETVLQRRFPSARVLRIDRDSMSGRLAWRNTRETIAAGQVDILVGTQILAKGHDFPLITLIGVLEADSGLYSPDFRAAERLYTQLLQVAGRAGRAGLPGEVLIQTQFADHPLFQSMVRLDYRAFAEEQLAERKAAGFPPYMHQALLRAEALDAEAVARFMQAAAASARALSHPVTIYDPVPARLARVAGKTRMQLLVQSGRRVRLQRFLAEWHEKLTQPALKKVRWALDVDPYEF